MTTFQAHISSIAQTVLSIDSDSVYIEPASTFETVKDSGNIKSGHWVVIAYNAGNATDTLEDVRRAGRRSVDHSVYLALANVIDGTSVDTLALLESFLDAVNTANTFKRADSESASGQITRSIRYVSDTAIQTKDNYTYYVVNYTEQGQ